MEPLNTDNDDQTDSRVIVLGNGLKIVAREVRSTQSIAVHGYLRVGAILEPETKTGIAALAANLLGRGTHKHSAAEVQTQLDAIGARVSFSAGRSLTVFKGRCLGEDAPLFLRLLADSLLFPAFPNDEIEKEHRRMRQWLQRLEENARYLAEIAFREILYGPAHPYSRPLGPTPATLAQFTHEDLLRFHDETYGSQEAAFVVTGNIRSAEIVRRIEDLFGDWQPARPRTEELPAQVPSPVSAITRRTIPNCRQAGLLIGAIGPARNNSDYYAAQAGNVVLGKLGIQGRIGTRLRENGLAYDCGSHLGSGLGPEPWFVHATLQPANLPRAMDLIATEVRRLCDELITEQEAMDAKSYLIGKQQMGLADLTGLAAALAETQLYQLGEDHLETYPMLIEQVTIEGLQAIAQRYLNLTACAYVTAEN